MNEEFEKQLVKLLKEYYSDNWDYTWEFVADSIVTKLWLGEEKNLKKESAYDRHERLMQPIRDAQAKTIKEQN